LHANREADAAQVLPVVQEDIAVAQDAGFRFTLNNHSSTRSQNSDHRDNPPDRQLRQSWSSPAPALFGP
jgi:hypothetical protein